MQPCCGWKQHWISDQDKENIYLWRICLYWILVHLVCKPLLPFYWYRHIRVQLPCNQISCLLSHYVPTGKGEEVTKVYSRALHPYLALITVWTVALWWPNRSDRIGSLWWSTFIFDRSIKKEKPHISWSFHSHVLHWKHISVNGNRTAAKQQCERENKQLRRLI